MVVLKVQQNRSHCPYSLHISVMLGLFVHILTSCRVVQHCTQVVFFSHCYTLKSCPLLHSWCVCSHCYFLQSCSVLHSAAPPLSSKYLLFLFSHWGDCHSALPCRAYTICITYVGAIVCAIGRVDSIRHQVFAVLLSCGTGTAPFPA